jgi:TPR repeat protein
VNVSARFVGLLFFMIMASASSTAVAVDDPAQDKAGDAAVHDVTIRIEARDCVSAVERLKAGLNKDMPKVALLAGTMYEHGVCVKRDWSKAVLFYSLAFNGGLTEAADRLAAGYADPANGPDVAAALWWGRQGRSFNVPFCAVSKEAAGDPDRFITELNTWKPSRLAGCNYVVGVMSTVRAELKYPKLGVAYQVGGDVDLRFLPGLARIEVKQGDAREYALLGWVDGDTIRDRNTKQVTGIFEKTLSDVANRALARYPQPPGLPADAKIDVRYTFNIE